MDWRDKLNALKVELPEGEPQPEEETVEQAVSNRQKEPLRIKLDKRKGKPSTLITDFLGSDEELKELTRQLKVKCSAGGSCRDGEILIQGDFRKKIAETLVDLGYKIKRINF